MPSFCKNAYAKPSQVGDDWEHDQLFQDPLTRLPTQLYPFAITKGTDESFSVQRQVSPAHAKIFATKLPTMFAAFRVMFEAYEEWWPRRPTPKVYFIGPKLATGQPVKIGFSLDVEARLATLQTGHHEKLRLFATVDGDRQLEAHYHKRWKLRRTNGEWFVLGKAILDEIDRIIAEQSPPNFRRSADRLRPQLRPLPETEFENEWDDVLPPNERMLVQRMRKKDR